MVNITVNKIKYDVDDNKTVLQVAKDLGIEIPRFCYDEKVSKPAACRLCVVEVEGARTLMPSCSLRVREGMVIKTHSKRVIDSRRMTLQLLIANHPSCLKCARNQSCSLQKYCDQLLIDEQKFKVNRETKKDSSVVMQRNNKLCILCGKCVRYCDEVQTVHAIDFIGRGAKTYIGCALDKSISKSTCIGCGQCILNCPTGALHETQEIEEVANMINRSEDDTSEESKKHIIAQIAPSVRVSLGELFGNKPGTVVTGKIVTALKDLGVDKVYDTQFAADLTIMEEANELLDRIKNKGKLPQFTSCCPGWVNFMETFYPDLIDHLSSCKSPQEMFSSLARTYYAKNNNIDPKDIKIVSIMPCTAKKIEKLKPEVNQNGKYKTDNVLTTREFAKLCNLFAINFNNLEDSDFDHDLGISTGAGAIFGNTGGVMEAALRTAYETTTGKKLIKVEFDQIRGYDGIKEGSIDINGTTVNFAVIHSLKNVRKILEDVRNETCKYHFIEVMACPGGCIGGGGQPRPSNTEILKKRIKGLYSVDSAKIMRRSYENPLIKELYKNYLGKPGSKKAHEILHTKHVARKNRY